MMRDRPIIVTESDSSRLRGLLARAVSIRDQEHLQELRAELERALLFATEEVPRDVVTMNARVSVLDLSDGQRRELVLVFPADADVASQRVSVLAPLGTALLGYREGDELEWDMPGGPRRLRIERVVQPRQSESGSAAAPFDASVLGAA